MTEYIEKEAAIDAVHGEFDECLVWDTSGLETANLVENILDTIPPADVRPVVRGEWIDDGCITRCKYCGEEKEFPHWRFCPNCGADMRGGDAE